MTTSKIFKITIELALIPEGGLDPHNYSPEQMVNDGHLLGMTIARFGIVDEVPAEEPVRPATSEEPRLTETLSGYERELRRVISDYPSGVVRCQNGLMGREVTHLMPDEPCEICGFRSPEGSSDHRCEPEPTLREEAMEKKGWPSFKIGRILVRAVRGPREDEPDQWYWRAQYWENRGQVSLLSMWGTVNQARCAVEDYISRRPGDASLQSAAQSGGAQSEGAPPDEQEVYDGPERSIVVKQARKRNVQRMSKDGERLTRYVSTSYVAMAKECEVGRLSTHHGKRCVWLTDGQREAVSELIRDKVAIRKAIRLSKRVAEEQRNSVEWRIDR